jgi:hypothetical protein
MHAVNPIPKVNGNLLTKMPPAQEESEDACININAFFARVTAAGVSDFTLYAIWTLREALEDPDVNEIAHQPSTKLLNAASVWFIYATDILANATKENKQFDGKMAKPGTSIGQAEWRGFCDDRWKVWKQRLSAASNADLSGDTKILAEKAVKVLENA